MKVLVISDTHIFGPKINFPKELEQEIEKNDFCVHAGDFTTYQVYKKISRKIKTFAVCGNMDDEKLQADLPKKNIFKIGGFTFGLIHGAGAAATLEQYIDFQFKNTYDKIDIFIYGHSHQPGSKEKKGKIYFNPGSIGDTITSYGRTYGILEPEGKNLKRSIHKLG